ncbi:hypothetical protein [Alteromonas sp. a30]|uniref:hypothetical protein n=1 Tax=Alteromonas sp. a30 TaxID=2730917 RepID=UPI002280B48C|nr:hypothetical protein [Alteromonas sp. a30]MCY7296677.1 hypothetical protein [Alteromonas sp. a30]
MKLSHKILSIIVTTFFLSFLAHATESNSANVNTLVESSSISSTKATSNQDSSTSSRTYVAQGGGGGVFPPDPSLASASNVKTFCVAGFCLTVTLP